MLTRLRKENVAMSKIQPINRRLPRAASKTGLRLPAAVRSRLPGDRRGAGHKAKSSNRAAAWRRRSRRGAVREDPRFLRQRWTRWALFALLPLALIAGGYWYVTGGQVMSTDDAYVEADKVGISTDVSGIVGRSTSRRTSTSRPARFCTASMTRQFQIALDSAEAQLGRCATISTR